MDTRLIPKILIPKGRGECSLSGVRRDEGKLGLAQENRQSKVYKVKPRLVEPQSSSRAIYTPASGLAEELGRQIPGRFNSPLPYPVLPWLLSIERVRTDKGPKYTRSELSRKAGSPKQASRLPACMATESPYYPNVHRNGWNSRLGTWTDQGISDWITSHESPTVWGKGDSNSAYQQTESEVNEC